MAITRTPTSRRLMRPGTSLCDRRLYGAPVPASRIGGDRRRPAIPGSANVPRRSATSLGRRGARPRLAAGRSGGGSGPAAAAGLAVVLAVKRRAVFQDRVELPGLAVRGVLD